MRRSVIVIFLVTLCTLLSCKTEETPEFSPPEFTQDTPTNFEPVDQPEGNAGDLPDADKENFNGDVDGDGDVDAIDIAFVFGATKCFCTTLGGVQDHLLNIDKVGVKTRGGDPLIPDFRPLVPDPPGQVGTQMGQASCGTFQSFLERVDDIDTGETTELESFMGYLPLSETQTFGAHLCNLMRCLIKAHGLGIAVGNLSESFGMKFSDNMKKPKDMSDEKYGTLFQEDRCKFTTEFPEPIIAPVQ